MLPPTNPLKRKTLVERAGETARPAPAPPNSRSINGHVKATSIAGPFRESSFSSSVTSSRPSSAASSRTLSNGSYGSSVGSGTRPPSVQSYRSQTAMGHVRSQKSASISARPATSLEVHEEEPGSSRAAARKKGRTPISSTPKDCSQSIHAPKVRGGHDPKLSRGSSWESRPYIAVSLRDTSLSTRFNEFHIDSEPKDPAPIAEAGDRASTPKVPSAPIVEFAVPQTPSHIPRYSPSKALPLETPSPRKPPKKTPKPLQSYLTRDSNTTIAFDTESRLEEVENQFSKFRDNFDTAKEESKSLKETTAVYKIRSMYEIS